jgi:hypothetical protein
MTEEFVRWASPSPWKDCDLPYPTSSVSRSASQHCVEASTDPVQAELSTIKRDKLTSKSNE